MRLLQIDAFTSRPFAGNPAAVCLLDEPAPEAWMQSVAAEMNLSETAFVVPRDDGFGLRWFTPACEVHLCGHATLASAHALFENGAEGPLTFHTKSGALTCRREGDAIEMDFPATPVAPCDPPDVPVEIVEAGENAHDLLLRLPDEAAVRSLDAGFGALLDRCVIVTAEGATYDFVSRYFARPAGIPEDPVTGSAHCTLGPFWAERLGQPALRAYQASQRGGEVGVRVAGDRVLLTGRAVTVLSGRLAPTPGADGRS